jgi:hypothetical protein
MKVRVVNTTILMLIVVSLLTGVYVIFVNNQLWLMTVHRISSIGIMLVLPWKVVISLNSLKRGWDWGKFDRSWGLVVSVVLAALAIASTLFAFMWAFRLGPYLLWLYQTVLAWHWILALVLLVPLLVHVWRKWPKPRTEEFTSRRGLMRGGALLLGSVAGWGIAEAIAQSRATDEEPRRITGSRGRGEFTGNDFPRTGEWVNPIDMDSWRFSINGAVASPLTLNYDELLTLPETEHIATLDCTLGWYTTQRWRGVALTDVLNEAGVEKGAVGFLLESVSGYRMPYTMAEADKVLLCTHIGDEVLSHKHGYPVRAVALHRRGWFWVKWMAGVQVVTAMPDFSAIIAQIEEGKRDALG